MKRLEPGRTEAERLDCEIQRIEIKAKVLHDLVDRQPDDARVAGWRARIAEIEAPLRRLRDGKAALLARGGPAPSAAKPKPAATARPPEGPATEV